MRAVAQAAKVHDALEERQSGAPHPRQTTHSRIDLHSPVYEVQLLDLVLEPACRQVDRVHLAGRPTSRVHSHGRVAAVTRTSLGLHRVDELQLRGSTATLDRVRREA